MTVLVLAGTSEANALVSALVSSGVDVVASLAGRTASPRPLPCPVRVGGFGGVDGLVSELRDRRIHALVDATHPFADEMPQHAQVAAAIAGVAHLRLVRPSWVPGDGDSWTEVGDLTEAAGALGPIGSRRALLAVGRQELGPFRSLTDVALAVRSVDEPPAGPWSAVLLGRGPFSFDEEHEVLTEHGIDTVVTRNSGGPRAKLDAARAAGVSVVMIRRPPGVVATTVTDVDVAVEWVLRCGR